MYPKPTRMKMIGPATSFRVDTLPTDAVPSKQTWSGRFTLHFTSPFLDLLCVFYVDGLVEAQSIFWATYPLRPCRTVK